MGYGYHGAWQPDWDPSDPSAWDYGHVSHDSHGAVLHGRLGLQLVRRSWKAEWKAAKMIGVVFSLHLPG